MIDATRLRPPARRHRDYAAPSRRPRTTTRRGAGGRATWRTPRYTASSSRGTRNWWPTRRQGIPSAPRVARNRAVSPYAVERLTRATSAASGTVSRSGSPSMWKTRSGTCAIHPRDTTPSFPRQRHRNWTGRTHGYWRTLTDTSRHRTVKHGIGTVIELEWARARRPAESVSEATLRVHGGRGTVTTKVPPGREISSTQPWRCAAGSGAGRTGPSGQGPAKSRSGASPVQSNSGAEVSGQHTHRRNCGTRQSAGDLEPSAGSLSNTKCRCDGDLDVADHLQPTAHSHIAFIVEASDRRRRQAHA
jgi:hypothetical protein